VNIPTVTNPSERHFANLALPTKASAPANPNMLTSAQKKGSPKSVMDGFLSIAFDFIFAGARF